MFSYSIQVLFSTTHGQCHQEADDLTGSIELTSFGIGGLLAATNNNLEYGSHHGITYLVWVKVSLLNKHLNYRKELVVSFQT